MEKKSFFFLPWKNSFSMHNTQAYVEKGIEEGKKIHFKILPFLFL